MDQSESNIFTCTVCSEEFDTADKRTSHELIHKEIKVEIETDSETKLNLIEQLQETSYSFKYEDQTQAEDLANNQSDKEEKVYNTRSRTKSVSYIELNNSSDSEARESLDSDYNPADDVDEHKNACSALISVELKKNKNEQENCATAIKNLSDTVNMRQPEIARVLQESVPNKSTTKISTATTMPKVLCAVNCGCDSVRAPFLYSKKIKFFCKYCSNIFNTIEIVSEHMDKTHNKQAEFNCLLCPSKFYDFQLLRQHFHSDHMEDKLDDYAESDFSTSKIENRVFECKDCGRILSTPKAYRTHKLRFHDQKNHVQCGVCKGHFHKLFFFKHKTGGHCARKMDSDSVICDKCGKTFKNSHRLLNHMKCHFDARYECNVCKKKYRLHAKKRLCEDKHANIRRYKCKLCTKSFFYSGSLIHHNRIHTGEKPYKCWICSRSFCSHQTLLKHCLSHGVSATLFRTEFKKRNGKSW